MNITDVEIELVNSPKSKIRAVCSIVLDNLLMVHNIKIIEGTNRLFLAMPRKELTKDCINCTGSNSIHAKFCNKCGVKLPKPEPLSDINGHVKRGKDIVWIVDSEFSKLIQQKVVKAYNITLKKPPVNPVKIVDSGGNKSMQRFIPKPLNASKGVKAKGTIPTDINEAGFPKFS